MQVPSTLQKIQLRTVKTWKEKIRERSNNFFSSILSESMLRSLVPAVERDKLAANRESSKSVMNSP